MNPIDFQIYKSINQLINYFLYYHKYNFDEQNHTINI